MVKKDQTDEKVQASDDADDPDEVVQFHLPASVKRALERHAKRDEGFRSVAEFQRTHWTKHLRELGLLPASKPAGEG